MQFRVLHLQLNLVNLQFVEQPLRAGFRFQNCGLGLLTLSLLPQLGLGMAVKCRQHRLIFRLWGKRGQFGSLGS